MAATPTQIDTPAPKIDCPNTIRRTTMATATPDSKQLIPGEIILRIIEVMVEAGGEKANRPTIICLGLTAHVHWNFLQTQYQMQKKSPTSSCFPTSLDKPFLDRCAMRQLIKVLTTWIGPNYRQVSELFLNETVGCQIMFLRRELYGDEHDAAPTHVKERNLARRLRLWKEYPLEKWPRSIPFYSPMLKTISCPYGMGMEWYPTAAREARNMMCHWEGFVHGSYGYRDTWDDAKSMFWLGYHRSCLWKWVKKNDEKDVPETKMVKEQLRQFEARVWKPVIASMQFGDSVTENWTSDYE